LECDKQCTVKENKTAYEIIDKASDEKLYYCPDDMIAVNDTSLGIGYYCKVKKNYQENKCYFKDNSSNVFNAAPKFFQVCGKINKGKSNNEIKDVEVGKIGSQEDDTFVWDEKACESGYAVYYPLNNNLSNINNDPMYKKCVTITGVEKRDNDCIIKYKIKDSEEVTYNIAHLKSLVKANNIDDKLFQKCEFLMKKLDLFKIYKKRLDYLETKGIVKVKNFTMNHLLVEMII
jgi:hypothetical protein